MRLSEWQDRFDRLLLPKGSTDGDTCYPNQEGFEVYRNNCTQALLGCLRKTFPICKTIVGDDCFNAWSLDYIGQQPLKTLSLDNYSAGFPRFLEELFAHANDSLKQALEGLDYLPDLAQAERLLLECYYASDQSEGEPLGDLAALEPKQQAKTQLQLRPDLRLMHSSHPILEVWQKHNDNLDTVELAEPKTDYYYLIHRDRYHGTITALSERQFDLLENIKRRQPLAKLVAQSELATELPALIERGWLTSFTVAKQTTEHTADSGTEPQAQERKL